MFSWYGIAMKEIPLLPYEKAIHENFLTLEKYLQRKLNDNPLNELLKKQKMIRFKKNNYTPN